MCFILTCIAAILVTGIYFLRPVLFKEYQLEHLALMYWGAALMWSVDGIFRITEGEAFCELSVNDTLLGVLVLICGILLWSALTFLHRKKSVL